MKINRLVGDYEPLLLQKEVENMYSSNSILLEIICKSKVDLKELLTMQVYSLVKCVSKEEIQLGDYLRRIEPEHIPVIEDLFELEYVMSLDPDGKDVIRSGEITSKQIETKEKTFPEIKSKPVDKFYIQFKLINKNSINDFFDTIDVSEIFRNILSVAIKSAQDLSQEHVKNERYKKVNYDFETKKYTFSDFGLKNVEKFARYCRFLFSGVFNDNQLDTMLKEMDLSKYRPLIESSHIKLEYFPNRKNTYKQLFDLID